MIGRDAQRRYDAWLAATPVPIIQHPFEFGVLLDLYRHRRPRRVLEVGTYVGGTLYHWLANGRPGALVVSVDLYTDADNSRLYDGWAAPGVAWETVRGDSNLPDTAAQAAGFGPYDWCFIDAGHRDHEVRADVELYLPLVRPGGVVAFHDVLPQPELPTIQVDGVWGELKRRYRSVEVAIPDGSGIGILFP